MIRSQHFTMITQAEQPASMITLRTIKTCACNTAGQRTGYACSLMTACHTHTSSLTAIPFRKSRTQPKNRISRKKQNKAPGKAGWLRPFSRYKYTGRELNPSGSMYYRYRTYFANVGRFSSRDPVGYLGGIGLYAYVGNRPVVSVDMYGLTPEQYVNPERAQEYPNPPSGYGIADTPNEFCIVDSGFCAPTGKVVKKEDKSGGKWDKVKDTKIYGDVVAQGVDPLTFALGFGVLKGWISVEVSFQFRFWRAFDYFAEYYCYRKMTCCCTYISSGKCFTIEQKHKKLAYVFTDYEPTSATMYRTTGEEFISGITVYVNPDSGEATFFIPNLNVTQGGFDTVPNNEFITPPPIRPIGPPRTPIGPRPLPPRQLPIHREPILPFYPRGR